MQRVGRATREQASRRAAPSADRGRPALAVPLTSQWTTRPSPSTSIASVSSCGPGEARSCGRSKCASMSCAGPAPTSPRRHRAKGGARLPAPAGDRSSRRCRRPWPSPLRRRPPGATDQRLPRDRSQHCQPQRRRIRRPPPSRHRRPQHSRRRPPPSRHRRPQHSRHRRPHRSQRRRPHSLHPRPRVQRRRPPYRHCLPLRTSAGRHGCPTSLLRCSPWPC
jgi:hypothetical protein